MWCIEAKARIDIPLSNRISEWTNQQFKKFIESKKTNCEEFDKALIWLGDKSYKEAMRVCDNLAWLNWLESNKPKEFTVQIPAGEKITVTKGKHEKYALWHNTGIWDLPEEYVGETIKVVSEN